MCVRFLDHLIVTWVMNRVCKHRAGNALGRVCIADDSFATDATNDPRASGVTPSRGEVLDITLPDAPRFFVERRVQGWDSVC